MSQNKSTTFLVTDAKNLTLIDATRENSPWWSLMNAFFTLQIDKTYMLNLKYSMKQFNINPQHYLYIIL